MQSDVCKTKGCPRNKGHFHNKPDIHPVQDYCCFICYCIANGIRPQMKTKWSSKHAAICDLVAQHDGMIGGTPAPPEVPDNVVLGYN